MAIFTAGAIPGFNMEALELFNLFEANFETKTAAEYRTFDDANNFTRFLGVGLTYSGAHPDTVLTGGTITSIVNTIGGVQQFSLTGASILATTLHNFYLAADNDGAMAALFSGNDTITGSAANDKLFGYAGNDRIVGGLGADEMHGGLGNDTYVLDNAGDVIVEATGAGTGFDTVESPFDFALGAGFENLTLTGAALIGRGNKEVNTIIGNGLSNVLEGFDNNDTLTGGGGNDVLDGGFSSDNMDGGAGNDVYKVDNAADKVIDASGIDRVDSWVDFTLGATIENLSLFGLAKTGAGNALVNVITGNSMDNSLSGENSNDTLYGGDGDDQLFGDGGENATGNDNVYGEAGNDQLIGGPGIDKLYGGTGDDVLNGDDGVDQLYGNAGDDIYNLDDLDSVIEAANEGNDTVKASILYTLTANVENLIMTSSANQNGTGNTLDNRITGNAFDNVINGGAGADVMRGLAGSDTYTVDNAGDLVFEVNAAGTDIVNSSVSFELGAFVENLTLTGAANINGRGNNLVNVINGNAGINVIDGKQGADTMNGFGGNDTYFRDDFGDVINDTAGVDTVNSSVTYTLEANLENLNITGNGTTGGFGNTLNNVITGNAFANSIEGNDGADTLEGGLGTDSYIGGAGADRIVFKHLAAENDKIFDFTHLIDDIVFSAAAFEDTFAGAAFVAGGAFAANRLVTGVAPAANNGAGFGQFLYDTGTGELRYDSNGTTAGGTVLFATLGAGVAPVLTIADFVIIA